MRDKVERLLDRLRVPEHLVIPLYMQGQCYALFLVLREVFPSASPFFTVAEGHIYTKINGRFYDIRGRCRELPRDLRPLGRCRDDPPHRWGRRDRRSLT